jgi:predicted RNA binding protein YcfA (HicA-like mRNA interferase family)
LVFSRFRPLKYRDVKTALLNLGFTSVKQVGSHEQWEKVIDGRKRKVTVAPHKGEVGAKDVRSIISQAGVSRKAFFDAF